MPKQFHIVMFPWLAFGHMIPYLELAKLIAARGHRVSFVSTSRNIDRLPRIPSDLSQLISLVKLKLPPDEGLPLDAEATIDVPYDKVHYLKRAYDGLQREMTNFLEGSAPDWILQDFAAHWLCPLAKRLEIGCAFFSIFSSSFLCVAGPPPISDLLKMEDYRTAPEHFTVPPRWIPFQTSVAFRTYEIMKVFDYVQHADPSLVTDLCRTEMVVRGCDLICVRGCYEFDPEWIQLLEKLHGKPVLPVGQLATSVSNQEVDESIKEEWLTIKAWLDNQDPASTVYVSFGSEAKPSQEEVTELSNGLEMSGLPFFWALRTRRGSSDEDVVKLPEGFEERVAGRGLVYTSWVPQLKILNHESVGGFLSHSGWSSVVEALQFGKALVLITFLADQGINARILEEKSMAYSVPRRESDGWFSRESVAQSLRLVMVEEDGITYRDKAKEMSKLFGNRLLQDGYVDNLLDYLQSHNV
uniref:Uncharacterized protein n=1 Tax=Kalanchoe fedtschenkoi TaxID=63787 RepID=A0A7N0V6N4_KALFE